MTPIVPTAERKPGPDRYLFETHDPDVGREYLSRAYEVGIKASTGGEDYLLRHTRIGPGSFFLDRLTHSASVGYQAVPPEKIVIGRVEKGLVELDIGGTDHFGPGQIFLASQPNESFSYWTEKPSTVSVLSIELATAAPLVLHPDEDGRPLVFRAPRPISPGAARHLTDTMSYVRHHVLGNGHAGGSPLVVGAAERLLASAALAAFPNSWIDEPERTDRTDATHRTLVKAVDFIESNADLEIAVADIAREARVSVRAVQMAFRRHRGVTPTAYLRDVRLDRAHRDLQAAGRDGGATVTDVALRWGFVDPGRFAQHYRRRYGKAPSDTLRGGTSDALIRE